MVQENLAAYLFFEGTNYTAYDYFGVHRMEGGIVFRVWAPSAEQIYVVGDFNEWQDTAPMTKIEGGIWEVVLPEEQVRTGDRYKYKIAGRGKECYKADPYGVRTECPPATATVVDFLDGYSWRDSGWMSWRKRKAEKMYAEPMNIYELHAGSWKRHEDGSYYTYGELATELATYVKQMGYTHVELLPIMEHPFDGSWGYQVGSFYAPSARFGTPRDFMGFIDSMHEAGIGVILDWVPAHFPKDEHGLFEFDGGPLYEYQSPERIEHAGWGTRRFDVGRNEVISFLVSNALFWLKVYHADGLRVDAVASMIYLDYDKRAGEWTPNIFGDHRCLEAISFFRRLNIRVKEYVPDALMIAEESTAWQGVTSLDGYNGLGFDMKWNMGWMNDTLAYTKRDPVYRKYHHGQLTFSMTYAFSETYLLPISHDEVVHGKGSLLEKMPGDYWQKFAGVRAYLGYMMTHPGKKLLFMGSEFGQFREWNHNGQLDWFLLDFDAHARLQHYVSRLNHFYLETPALWEVDRSWEGFCWIDANNRDHSILSYRRIDRKGREVLVLINFTPVAREEYLLGVPEEGRYEELLNSDSLEFGGSGVINKGILECTGQGWNNCPNSIRLRIPPLGISILRCCGGRSKK